MTKVILIRPGSTDYDQQARIQGRLDIPLSDQGRQEAQKIAEKLKTLEPEALFCSPCSSASETAKIVGQALSLKPKSVDRLLNMNLGLWQGLLIDEVRLKQTKLYKQWMEHPETIRPPEGEIVAEVAERVDEALDKLARKHKSGVVAVVAPEPLASIVRQRITNAPLGDLWHATNGGERFEVLNFDPEAPKPSAKITGTNGTNGTEKAEKPSQPRIIYRGVAVQNP